MSLTSKEAAQAGNALVEWFNSQELSPNDAKLIMSKVLASMLARGVKTRLDANEALDAFTLQLVNDLNARLYNTRHGGR